MDFTTLGPLYTNEEYNCTKLAPLFSFSLALMMLDTPPTPIIGIAPFKLSLTFCKVRLLKALNGSPDNPPHSLACSRP